MSEKRNPCVLIVDDKPLEVEAIAMALRMTGYDVIIISSAKEAMDTVQNLSRSVTILLDERLGKVKGSSLIAEFLEITNHPIQIVMHSGDDSPAAICNALDSGALKYLIKGIDPRVILSELGVANRELTKILKKRIDERTGALRADDGLEQAEKVLRHAIRKKTVTSFVLIDLDGLKLINDTLGHDIGNKVLQFFVLCMLTNVRPDSDLVVRLGGDEFLVVLTESKKNQAQRVLKRITTAAAKYNLCTEHGQKIPTTFSCGIAVVFPKKVAKKTEITLQNALRQADAAMYKQKYAKKVVVKA